MMGILIMDTENSTALITLSELGYKILLRILDGSYPEADIYLSKKLTISLKEMGYDLSNRNIMIYQNGIVDLCKNIFSNYKAFVYIMPIGVVLRTISDQIMNKYVDPAVVVVDIGGRWVIPILSGHEGGANKVAERVALSLNSRAIITTSSEAGKNLIVGIGMRKGVKKSVIAEAVHFAMDMIGEKEENIRLISTVERKKKEKGLLEYCRLMNIPLRSISINEIKHSMRSFKESTFVKKILGIGAVAEPSAILAGEKTKIILKRIKWKGVTVAVARENFSW